ncbi:MAG: DUF4258 domain-containing protein [Planctomycetes bacterium]|nr:DUF4258 domain-containing protein [Planctomycetota bacterium]
MSNLKDIKFTKHAEDMLAERGFQKETIIEIVAKPEWKNKGEGDIWYAFKRIGGKVLRVVVKGNKPFTVITMFFDRRLK